MNWIVIGSSPGVVPIQRHAIMWTNANWLPVEPPGKKLNEISIK